MAEGRRTPWGLGPACLLALLAGAPAALADGLVTRPHPLRPALRAGDTHMGVRLLGAVEIVSGTVDGIDVTGLSGLAWDDDDGILYAVSDRGALFHLRPAMDGETLTGVQALAAFRLTGADGAPLRGGNADAEGVDAVHARNGRAGDTRLLVAFERRHRIAVVDPRGGTLETLALPPPLDDDQRFASFNKGLESVAVHPRLGILTAPERPLRGAEDMAIVVRSLDGGAWRHALHWTLNGSIVALEALPDGSVLVLERGHGLLYLPVVITLQHAAQPSPDDRALGAAEVAVFDTSKGWSVDNFEGLTRYRGRRFFMVSDDNAKAVQRTLLVHFELL